MAGSPGKYYACITAEIFTTPCRQHCRTCTNITGVTEEAADCGDAACHLQRTVHMLLEELNSKLVDVNEESGCNEKDEDVLEKVTLVINFALKELSGMFHDMESTKDRSLDASLSLRRQFTNVQEQCSL